MANSKHLKKLREGVDSWNRWRAEHPRNQVDLKEASLHGANLQNVDFRDADLTGADLSGSDLSKALLQGALLKKANLDKAQLAYLDLEDVDFSFASLVGTDLLGAHLLEAVFYKANLSEARVHNAELFGAHLRRANLRGADLSYSRLIEADLRNADLEGANLAYCTLHGTNFGGANLTKVTLDLAVMVDTHLEKSVIADCSIYGIAAWNVGLEGSKQSNLRINAYDEPTITVDNLEVGQFIHLLLKNQKLRSVIDTVTSKAVLILGRFIPERKTVLDALREQLQQLGYLPILFDFDKPASRNLTETVSTIAHLSRFVIADISDARSIPQELQRIVPHLPSVPVQPIISSSFKEYAMFVDFLDYPTVLRPFRYSSLEHLLTSLEAKVIAQAVKAANRIAKRRVKLEKEMAKMKTGNQRLRVPSALPK
jgi:uncharacterized protein YjbI with pentapeptide repeats